ncbi:MAG: amidohydrolase [Chloroflexi bacterium]|nr:amidohydrolase [Chloroflexota bacterium]
MEQRILDLAHKASARAALDRRDFHQYPELAYTELRTASLIARRLADLGWAVQAGRPVMAAESRYGMPPAGVLAGHYERAIAEGADPEFLEQVKDGFPAVVGSLSGGRPGPTVAIRVDIDALPIEESAETSHFPARAGFASRHPGVMHACGHDANAAIGLALADVFLAVRDEIAGTIKLIFQPGEEGGRGAIPMLKAGVVEGVDFFIGLHLGMRAPSGTIYPTVTGFLASTKLDVVFKGSPAHAAADPELGRNALVGAAQAVLGLYAISRHSGGMSRINVGVLQAGTSRNIIPDHARMLIETRGETAEIDAYVQKRARAVIEGAALAHDLEVEITPAGSTSTSRSDPALARVVAEAARAVPGVTPVEEPLLVSGSEDATFLMRRVQEQGGQAVYIGIGSDMPTGHHTHTFDIQEKDLFGGIATVALAAVRLGHDPDIR